MLAPIITPSHSPDSATKSLPAVRTPLFSALSPADILTLDAAAPGYFGVNDFAQFNVRAYHSLFSFYCFMVCYSLPRSRVLCFPPFRLARSLPALRALAMHDSGATEEEPDASHPTPYPLTHLPTHLPTRLPTHPPTQDLLLQEPLPPADRATHAPVVALLRDATARPHSTTLVCLGTAVNMATQHNFQETAWRLDRAVERGWGAHNGNRRAVHVFVHGASCCAFIV